MACYDMYGQGAQTQCSIIVMDSSGTPIGFMPQGCMEMGTGVDVGTLGVLPQPEMSAAAALCCSPTWMSEAAPWQAQMVQQPMLMMSDPQQSAAYSGWDANVNSQMTAGAPIGAPLTITHPFATTGVSLPATPMKTFSDPGAASVTTAAESGEQSLEEKLETMVQKDARKAANQAWADIGHDEDRSNVDTYAPLACEQAYRCSASSLRRRRRQRAAIPFADPAIQPDGSQLLNLLLSRSEARTSNDHAQVEPISAGPTNHGAQQTKDVNWAEEARCRKLAADLEARHNDVAISAASSLRGDVYRMSCDAAGCRVIQQALSVLDRRTAEELVSELHGHVREVITSPHGNYVIQKVVEALPFSAASFVVKELRGHGAATARHRFGCRIICRLMEQSGKEASTAELADEVLEHSEELCRHSFGHHVVQSILEHGLPRHGFNVARALCNEPQRNARNRNASYAIEKALTYCSLEDQEMLASSLLSTTGGLASLIQNQFGAFVARALIRRLGASGQEARDQLDQLKIRPGPEHQKCQQQAVKHLHRLLEEHLDEHVQGALSSAAAAAA
eukprot:TRINITY_DN20730_c0_g1_i4.p1 TRINITY_DN20730_c0_g1~~TRINITY_DN20730_c0_g1_i4.p1  ORF type:complete len:563 (+),score=100.13 TRINITY_DN20730_c0_g1_i4:55-1743(+)